MAANSIKHQLGTTKFDVALILGSCHKQLPYDQFENIKILEYASVPYLPIPTNIGHGRDIIYGELHGQGVIAYSGRIHSFEGYRTQYHSFLAYLSAFLGCRLLISTNSCGSIHPDLKVGDICLIYFVSRQYSILS